MKVLHVDTAHEWRGGQVQLRTLVTHAAGDHQVVVDEGGPLHDTLRRDGVQVHPVRFRGRWRGARSLREVVRRVVPDVVAVHTGHAHVHADRIGDLPIVLHRRLDFVPSRAGRARARRAHGVIAVSAAVAAVLRAASVAPARIRVVPDGVRVASDPAVVNPRSGLGLPPDTPLLVAVGALVAHKGHRTLVDALPALPGVHAVVVGEGPLREALRRRAARLGVGGRLHLVGHRPARAWQAGADVVCHPSHDEGLGQAVVEALLLGAAVVASRTGGLPEAVCGAGRLVAPADPKALARALRSALRDRDALRHAARLRRPWLQARYGVEGMVGGTLAAYAAFCDLAAARG